MICAALLVLVGLDSSRNLGESPHAFVAQAAHVSRYAQARAFFNSSDKVESGAGHILGADVDWMVLDGFTPTVGLGYRYRDGGAWIERSLWARAGIAYKASALVSAVDMSTTNRVRSLELCARLWRGRLWMEQRVGLVSYVHAGERELGTHTSVSVGIAL